MRYKKPPKHILLTIIVTLAVLFGGTLVVAETNSNHHAKPAASSTAQIKKAAPISQLSYKGQDGKTALDLLKTHAKITTKDSSYGVYVDSISGVAGGTNGKYWTLYINGAQSQVGAGAYTTKSTDTITWKFQ